MVCFLLVKKNQYIIVQEKNDISVSYTSVSLKDNVFIGTNLDGGSLIYH